MCNLHFVFHCKHTCYFVLDLFWGGDLAYFIKHYRKKIQSGQSDTFVLLMSELLVAVNYLHEMCVVHRDLKPANIVLDERGQFSPGESGESEERRGQGSRGERSRAEQRRGDLALHRIALHRVASQRNRKGTRKVRSFGHSATRER